MSHESQKALLDIINLHKEEWNSKRHDRINHINAAVLLMENSIKETNSNIIDRVINDTYTDMNSTHGPTRSIDAHDYMFIKTVFPHGLIVIAEKFIYTEEMHQQSMESLNNRNKRKLDILPTTQVSDVLAIQPYDVSCERIRGYQFTSYNFAHFNTATWNTTYILARVTSGAVDANKTIHASYAYPLYKLKLAYASSNVTNRMSEKRPK